MKKNRFVKIASFIYLIFLVWLIIFKFNISLSDIHRVRELNLIPFHYENVMEGDIPLFEALFNVLVFIPFGFLLHRAFRLKAINNILLVIGLSLFFEITQYALAIGATDITDLITNTIGGILGIVIAKIFMKRKN